MSNLSLSSPITIRRLPRRRCDMEALPRRRLLSAAPAPPPPPPDDERALPPLRLLRRRLISLRRLLAGSSSQSCHHPLLLARCIHTLEGWYLVEGCRGVAAEELDTEGCSRGNAKELDREGGPEVCTGGSLEELDRAGGKARALQERFYFGDDILPCFETGIPLLLKRLHELPDAANITIAFPDDGAWKRFHKQLEHFPMVYAKSS